MPRHEECTPKTRGAGEIGFNADALGWYAAGQALPMMPRQASVPNIAFSYQRMFTAENVGVLGLIPDAEKSGAWYGANDYQDGFKKLWASRAERCR